MQGGNPMANQKHVNLLLKQGVAQWNAWRVQNEQNQGIQPDLSHADLSGADLSHANLSHADLSNADLNEANLFHSNLSGADLSGAKMWDTILAYVDFSETKGLVKIKHRGPSVVQLNTISLPQDGSAFHFLRGTGIPEEWIDFYRTQMMHPIQYHSCFISYSSKDDSLAQRLHADLQAKGVRCWFAAEDMKT